MKKEERINFGRVLKASSFFVATHLVVYLIYWLLHSLMNIITSSSEKTNLTEVNPVIYDFSGSMVKMFLVSGTPSFILLILGLLAGKISLKAVNKNVFHYFLHWFSISAPLLTAGLIIATFFYRITMQDFLDADFFVIYMLYYFPTYIIFIMMIIVIFLSIFYGYMKAFHFPAFYMNPGKNGNSLLKKFFFTEQLILPVIFGCIPVMLMMNEKSVFIQFFSLLAYAPFIMGTLLMKKSIPFRFKNLPNIYAKIHWSYILFFFLIWIYAFLEIKNFI